MTPTVNVQLHALGQVAGKRQWFVRVDGVDKYSVIERSFVCFALYELGGTQEPLGTFYDLERVKACVRHLEFSKRAV